MTSQDFDPDAEQGSRIPSFYKLGVTDRRKLIAERSKVSLERLDAALESGGLDASTADKVVENVLGLYGLPLGIALNVRVNGVDRLVPMVVEEPSVIAAASNAAKMVRAAGGFSAEMLETWMTTQIQLTDVQDVPGSIGRLEHSSDELLGLAAQAVPGLLERGGGPRGIEVRNLGQGVLVLHVHVECKDAMGANLVNSVAEIVGPRAREITGGRLGLRILTNLCDRRRVRVKSSGSNARERYWKWLPEFRPGSRETASWRCSRVAATRSGSSCTPVACSRFRSVCPSSRRRPSRRCFSPSS